MARPKTTDYERIWELFVEMETTDQVKVLKDLEEAHELCVWIRRNNRGKKRTPKEATPEKAQDKAQDATVEPDKEAA